MRPHLLPLLLAAAVTLLNAAKPVVVDDTAYLTHARHLAHDPLHPYSFTLFWYYVPQPANEILLPPVLPYWLAAGIALFGEHLVLLKLWLFPFAWVLTLAVRSLLRRFVPNAVEAGTFAFVLSPVVLPLFAVMLDVPALALGAAAVALFVKGCDGGSLWRVALAGLCCGLAMQTKYSMLAVPPVLMLYALTRFATLGPVRAILFAVLSVGVGVGLFVGWERYMIAVQGESHFARHLSESGGGGDVWATLVTRFSFAPPLLGQFGGLAVGISVAAAAGVGWPRWVRWLSAAITTVGFAVVCSLSYSAGTPWGDRYSIPYLIFAGFGVSVIVSALVGLVRVLLNGTRDADTLFLAGWVAGEAVAMLGLTPFPAARRTMGVCLAMTVLLFHLGAKLNVTPPRWGVAFAVGVGLLVWGLDCWDAQAERALADRAAEVAKPGEPGTVWFSGNWGFKYHCERAGMTQLVTLTDGVSDHRSQMQPGDRFVLPLLPPDGGFYRPWPPDRTLPHANMPLVPLAVFEWDDPIRGQTIPNLYGGSVPISGRDYPRLRVAVYRVTRAWRAE